MHGQSFEKPIPLCNHQNLLQIFCAKINGKNYKIEEKSNLYYLFCKKSPIIFGKAKLILKKKPPGIADPIKVNTTGPPY
jgi:hypothetical protein